MSLSEIKRFKSQAPDLYKAIRNQALEEAAKKVEGLCEYPDDIHVAQAIRELKES